MQTPIASGNSSSPRRTLLLAAIAVVLGLAAGGAAWVLLRLIALITNLALRHRWSWADADLAGYRPDAWLPFAAMAGALVVSLLARWAPQIRGHGMPEAMEAILTKQSRIRPRVAVAKPLSAAVAIGTGGPFGAEGPIIVTGGALGSLIGQVVPVSPAERKILLASGAAAGMAATFGSPLAAVILAIELFLFEFSTRSFVPLVIASSVAGAAHIALFGGGALFGIPPHGAIALGELPLFAALGVACGGLAIVIARGLVWFEDLFEKLPLDPFWYPVVGALGFASVGLFVPRVLGVGYSVIEDTLAGRLAISALVVLLVAKMGAWWIALASGTSGGTLAPILLMSACFGSLFGHLVDPMAGGVPPQAFALVAMAATFGAATRATFASIVFIFELTRDYRMIIPLMFASVIAGLIARAAMRETLLTEKLARRGINVRGDYEVDAMKTTLVRDVMTSDVEVLLDTSSVGEARARFAGGTHSAYPVVDRDMRLHGIVARRDLMDGQVSGDAPVGTVASPDVVTIRPDQTVFEALRAILEDEVEHLPVLEDGRVVGICTRTDVLRARRGQLHLERRPEVPPAWRVVGGRLSLRRTGDS